MILHSSVHIRMFTAHLNTEFLMGMIKIKGNNRCETYRFIKNIKNKGNHITWNMHFNQMCIRWSALKFKAAWLIPGTKQKQTQKTALTIKMQCYTFPAQVFWEINNTQTTMFMRCVQIQHGYLENISELQINTLIHKQHKLMRNTYCVKT